MRQYGAHSVVRTLAVTMLWVLAVLQVQPMSRKRLWD
jgi:hypothetical protein